MKILKRFLSCFSVGTVGEVTLPENRITVFINIVSVFAMLASLGTAAVLRTWGISGFYLLIYFVVPLCSCLAIYLNAKRKHLAARTVTGLLLNLAAWNALVFYGKSFNGYLVFYAAIVFSIVVFNSRHGWVRWMMLGLSLAGPLLADYLSFHDIVPVTDFVAHQSVAILFLDTITLCGLIVGMLLIEKSLARINEGKMLALNKNLEEMVETRTASLTAARQVAVDASNAKSQFVANTSHELRTPLGAIIGFVDLLLAKPTNDEESERYLRVVQRNAGQLLQLVNEVLDLSKVEADKLEVKKEPFALANFIEDLESLMSLKAEDKGLGFSIIKRTELPEIIFTDLLRLKQILVNLLGNAIKFTTTGSVTTSIYYLSAEDKLVFEISDTGPGVNLKDKKNIFEPFSQGDSTLMRKFGGTGLGLSLSKRLADLLNADLDLISSSPEEGSTFCLVLRDVRYTKSMGKSNLLMHPSAEIIATLENKKILVVDDSLDNQMLVREFLQAAGAEVDVLSNGKELVDRIDDLHQYNTILLDLQMPAMDGYEAMRILQQHGCETPVIAFTAHVMNNQVDKLKGLGFAGYLSKPVTNQSLLAILAEKSTTSFAPISSAEMW